MSKSDTPLERIETSRARKDIRKPDWSNGKPVVAFDFETMNGEPFMLAVSNGKNDANFVLDDNGNTISSERLFEHLTSEQYRDCICVWFNLGFDAEILLSALPRDKLETLQVENQVSYEGQEITYIPNKMLQTRDSHGNKITHYDVSALFRSSLDQAAEEWLGENKDESVDASKFGNPEYVRENYIQIKRYARLDADLTRRITEKLIRVAEDIDIPCGRPVSTGFLAAEYLRNRLSRKPGWGTNEMQSMAWEAYAGGRFEVYRRGDIGEVAGPDINSAYPAVMADLPDPDSLAWEVTGNPTVPALREADYGFVDVTVTTDSSRKIQPFAVKVDNKVKYPALDNYRLTVLKPIFNFALDSGLIEDFTLHKASLGYETDKTRFPFDFFSDKYKTRKEWESNDKDFRALLLKIILNSMYGKTAQTTLKRNIPGESIDPAEVQEQYGDSASFRSMFGKAVVQTQEAGELFNPFIASYITGMTRLQLHKTVYDLGLVDETVMLATDCIMVEADAYHQSDFDDLMGDTLGEWDFDYQGEAFVIGSGVYEVRKDSGDLKQATRGFRESKIDSFRQEAERVAPRDWIAIESERPTTLGEALTMPDKFSLSDVGVFREPERKLYSHFDDKRQWPCEATYEDLLAGSQSGDPVIVSGD